MIRNFKPIISLREGVFVLGPHHTLHGPAGRTGEGFKLAEQGSLGSVFIALNPLI